jgi:hypothetical protein
MWSDKSHSCVATNPHSNKINIIVSLVSDVVLLLIMLVGLLHQRIEISKFGNFGLGRLLWNQVRWWQFLLALDLLI